MRYIISIAFRQVSGEPPGYSECCNGYNAHRGSEIADRQAKRAEGIG